VEPKRSRTRILTYLLKRLLREKGLLVIGLLVAVGEAIVGLAMINTLRPFIDEVFVNKNSGATLPIVYYFLRMTVVASILMFCRQYVLALAGTRVVFELREKVFAHLQRLGMKFYRDRRLGDIMSRLSIDLDLLQNFYTTTITTFLTEPVAIVAGIIFLLSRSPRLTLLSFIVFPLIGVVVLWLGRLIRRASRATRLQLAEIASYIHESIEGMPIIQLFTIEKRMLEGFKRESRKGLQRVMREFLVKSASAPSIQIIGAVGFSLILYFSVRETQLSEYFTEGTIVVYIVALMNKVINPLRKLNDAYLGLQMATVAGARIVELEELEPDVVEAADAVELPRVRGEIEFAGVTFGYEDSKPVLKGVNLKIPAGKTVALVGPSGVGKSTIVHLLLRFYDPWEGSIRLDGVDIRRLKLDFLRKVIGVVPQDTFLFNTTIAENIRMGNSRASEQQVIEAAKKALVHDFVMDFPQKYETGVGSGGSKLSGGERQRIAIARALIKEPPVLVMDEAVSGLDADSEKRVNDAFFGSLDGRTALLIAHRLSTADRADYVAVLMDGRIVEFGPPAELLARPDGAYRRLHDIQFAGIGNSSDRTPQN
jgi:ABC-type multidrug transport system fused ATPase/permease subunit